jgi:hypothetical protein
MSRSSFTWLVVKRSPISDVVDWLSSDEFPFTSTYWAIKLLPEMEIGDWKVSERPWQIAASLGSQDVKESIDGQSRRTGRY